MTWDEDHRRRRSSDVGGPTEAPRGPVNRYGIPIEDELRTPGKRPLVASVQRRAAPGSAPARHDADESLAEAQDAGGGAPLPTTLADMFGRGLGADLSRVRLHTDDAAAHAADAVSARAFTTGHDIYFAQGAYDPHSVDGQHLLAHEVTHTVQQGGATGSAPQFKLEVSSPGDALEHEADQAATALLSGAPVPAISRGGAAIARLPIMGPMSGGGSGDTTPEWQKKAGTAQEYVKKHGNDIIQGLHTQMSTAALATGMIGADWAGGNASGFAGQFCLMFFMQRSDPWSFLVETAAPEDVSRIVDQGRDAISMPDQAQQWNNGVVFELAKLYTRRLTESLQRIVPRYVAVWNQHVLAEEAKPTDKKRKKDDPLPTAPEPAEGQVRASSPLDPYVIRALRTMLAVDFRRFRELNPAERQAHAIDAIDKVTLSIQWQQQAINWARVSPPEATAEDVAAELYGSETMAYLITAAPPLFGFDTRFENRQKLKPAYRDELDRIQGSNDYHGSTGGADPASQILAGPLGDEAALNQGKHVKPTPGISKGAIVERMRNIVGELDWLQKSVERWGQQSLLDAARKKVDERSRHLDKAEDPDAAAAWDGQSQAQLQVVGFCRNAVQTAAAQEDAFKTFPSARWLIINLVRDYVEAAAISDLVETARARVLAADQKSRAFPADLMDALLDTMRPVIQAAKVRKTGADGAVGTVDPARYDAGAMEKKENELRQALVKVREVLLQNPEQARAELDRLLREITTLSTEVTLVANMDSCEAAWASLHESLSTVGEIVSVFSSSHGNDVLRADQAAVTKMHGEWRAIYGKWKAAATPEDKKKVEDELQRQARSPEWTDLFARVGRHIKDTATLNKWVTFGVMVGIALITGGIGAYVEAAAGAAWGAAAGFAASTVTEAAAFSSMSYLLVEKDPSLNGFFGDISKNILMFGALKGVGKIYAGVVGEAAAAGGAGQLGGILVQFTALNGHALYEADQEKRRRTGQGLTEDEIVGMSFENLAFIAAVAIGGALGKTFLAGLVLEGQLQGQLIAARGARVKAFELSQAVEAARGKDPAKAQALNKALTEALAKEEAVLTGVAERVKAYEAGDKSALTEKAYLELKTAMAEHAAHVVELKRGQIADLLEPGGPNHFYVAKGHLDQVIDHFATIEKDVKVQELGEPDPVTGARTVELTPKSGQPWRVTERIAGTDRTVSVQGLAQEPSTYPWKLNADGKVRTMAEAVEIARQHGVLIPDDIRFVAVKAEWLPPKAFAEYLNREFPSPDVRIEWEDLYTRFDDIAVKMSKDVLSSDEAIVAIISHEMHELNGLRDLFAANGGAMTAGELHRLIHPGRKGNLHDQAWDVADAHVRKMRQTSGGTP